MLKDEEYVNNVTEMLPVWTAEGRKELSDSRNVWDWINYNIRAHAINYSKKKPRKEMQQNQISKMSLEKQSKNTKLHQATLTQLT